jgi:hypothetical protein
MEEALTMWDGRKVMMLLPVYRSFCADTHYSLFSNYAKYGAEKIGMEIIKRTVIHEARNILIDKFMKSGAETAIMCDDDMILPVGNPIYLNGNHNANIPPRSAGFNAISRIMSHGREKGIVGALYFGRHELGQAQCELGFGRTRERENEKLRAFGYTDLVPTGWVGTGFIKIERWVVDKLKEEINKGTWPECKPHHDGSWYGVFSPLGAGIGEDVSFCTRAKKLGIQTYLDSSLICLHQGERNYGPRNTRNI